MPLGMIAPLYSQEFLELIKITKENKVIPVRTIEVIYDWSIHKWKIQTFNNDTFIGVDIFMCQKDAVVNAHIDFMKFQQEFKKKPNLRMYEKSGATARFDTPHKWMQLAKKIFEEKPYE